ncbi:MAG: hypothetical protein GYA50_02705 [Eubacteriaceae bacterium]|nr:hypothetical protein [Eubacteriaceae bacterium]
MKLKKTIPILLVIFALLTLASCGSPGSSKGSTDSTKPTVAGVHMTSKLNNDGTAADTVDSYLATLGKFIVTGQVKNAPQTKISFVWKYNGASFITTELITGDTMPKYISNSVDNYGKAGNYSVEVYLVEDNTQPVTFANFTIKLNPLQRSIFLYK